MTGLRPGDEVRPEPTTPTPESEISRVWRDDLPVPGTIHLIGTDSGWHRWNVTPGQAHYRHYEAILGRATPDGWIRPEVTAPDAHRAYVLDEDQDDLGGGV